MKELKQEKAFWKKHFNHSSKLEDLPNAMQHVNLRSTEVSDLAKVKARLADPALKKIMTDAGVIGNPTMTFYKDASN